MFKITIIIFSMLLINMLIAADDGINEEDDVHARKLEKRSAGHTEVENNDAFGISPHERASRPRKIKIIPAFVRG